jgi:hypothetical protein
MINKNFTISDLRKLKKAKFLRTLHQKNKIETLDQFKDYCFNNHKENQKIESFEENKEFFIVNYLENNSKKTGKMRKTNSQIVEITFRSKDYIFEFEGKTCYGDELKKDNLTKTGFKIETYSGDLITYDLIN